MESEDNSTNDEWANIYGAGGPSPVPSLSALTLAGCALPDSVGDDPVGHELG